MNAVEVAYTSEAEWLDERRIRVTATDIARLANGGPAVWAAVKAEKHGAGGFSGNVYTAWGSEREPVIVERLGFLYDVTPNQSLWVDGNWAATPDAVSPTRNGEAKTTVRDWGDLDGLHRVHRDYVDQMQWAMLVRDVGECVLGWEPHENFQPLPIRDLIVPRDEGRIAELVEIAERFRVYLDEDGVVGEFDDLIALYSERAAVLAEAQAAVDEVRRLVRVRAGDRSELSVKGPHGSVSMWMPKPSPTFDSAAFRKAHPDLAAEYVKPGRVQTEPSLRITPVGGAR